MLAVSDIIDVRCMKFWYTLEKKSIPDYFGPTLIFHNKLYQIEARCRSLLHLFSTRIFSARNVLRYRILESVQEYPMPISIRTKAHSIQSFFTMIKAYIIWSYSYKCIDINCYFCERNVRWFFTILIAYTGILWIAFSPLLLAYDAC